MTCLNYFTYLGVALVAFWAVKALLRLKRFFVGHFTGPAVDFRSLGKYAVITGATDGIGKALAFELARYGMDLVLISRTKSRLDDTASELKRDFPNVDVKTIVADFSRTDIYESIQRDLADIDVGLLVNNVGALSDGRTPLHELPRQLCLDMINLNMTSTVVMSQIVLPKMVEKRRGGIINLSSIASILPPRHAIYSAAKTFVKRFSHALRLQYSDKGIVVQDIQPSYVETKLVAELKTSKAISAETCARQTLKTFGHYDETSGAIQHDVVSFVLSLLPEGLILKAMKATDGKAHREESKKQK